MSLAADSSLIVSAGYQVAPASQVVALYVWPLPQANKQVAKAATLCRFGLAERSANNVVIVARQPATMMNGRRRRRGEAESEAIKGSEIH